MGRKDWVIGFIASTVPAYSSRFTQSVQADSARHEQAARDFEDRAAFSFVEWFVHFLEWFDHDRDRAVDWWRGTKQTVAELIGEQNAQNSEQTPVTATVAEEVSNVRSLATQAGMGASDQEVLAGWARFRKWGFDHTDMAVLTILLKYERPNGHAYPSAETIANALGVGVRTVYRSLKRLKDKLILWEPGAYRQVDVHGVDRPHRTANVYDLSKYREEIKVPIKDCRPFDSPAPTDAFGNRQRITREERILSFRGEFQ